MITPMPVDMDILADLNLRYSTDEPLGPLTWYGVGGNAAVLAHPSSTAQLSELTSRCRQAGIPVYVLGSGANLLVADEGVDGVVVRLDDPAFSQMRIEGQQLTAGAGFDLFKLVLAAARAGLGGLEVLAGIPASVGGAVRMNAGGAFGDIGSAVKRVQVMSESGQVFYRDRDDLRFSYRSSNITAPYILEVTFDLVEDEPDDLMRRVKEIFLYKKNSQPMAEASAGCVFKNPPEDVGATAGQLIDRAGLKGCRIGSAVVSDIHANFIIIDDKANARANDVKNLIQHVSDTVAQKFAVTLERELVIWP